MKKSTNKMRALSVVLSLLMIFSVISFPTIKAKAAGTIDDFVERCYTVILNRPSEAEGFADWKNQLVTGQSVGAQVAYGFIFSQEYKNRNRTNEQYVTDLYKLFMDRDPDEGGFNDWVGKLNSGASREEIYVGFVNSQEFYDICDSYGITAGAFYNGFDRNKVNEVNLFVNRLYDTCLGRRGDRKGQQDWVKKLLNKEITGIECARSFVQSKEYVNKNLSNEEYVENMYVAMMGRASDAEGKSNWLNALAEGKKTRDEVFAGFANSAEFGNICNDYSINKGSYTAKDVAKPDDPSLGEKKYRVAKIIYKCGDYSLLTYEDANVNVTSKRFDKDGNFKGYDEIHEHSDDYTIQKDGSTIFDKNGEIVSKQFYKYVYNEDFTIPTYYVYSDEWKTLTSYAKSETEKRTFTENDGTTYESYIVKKETRYDSNNNILGYSTFEHDSYNNLIKQEDYNAEGIIQMSQTTEYYNDKNSSFRDAKIYTYTYYYDGVEEYKSQYEYNKNGNTIYESYYYNGFPVGYGVYSFDDKGNETKFESFDMSDNLTNYKVTKYDSKGNIAEITYYNADDTFWNQITYEYNDKNLLAKVKSFVEYGDTTETLYQYNERGEITKMTQKVNGTETDWEEYQYEVYYVK